MRLAASVIPVVLLIAVASTAHAQMQSMPTDGGALIVELSPSPDMPQPGEVVLGINFVNPTTQDTQVHIDYAMNVTMGGITYASVERSHTAEGRVRIPMTLDDAGTYEVTVMTDGIFFQPIPAQFAMFSLGVGVASGTTGEPAPSENGGGCLVATAAYGTELAPQVQSLRELRDRTVMGTESGRAFMALFNSAYYAFSPAIADMERQNEHLRGAIALAITPMVATLGLLEGAGIEGDAEMVSYGLAVIALNVGMYVGTPALAVVGIRRLTARRA